MMGKVGTTAFVLTGGGSLGAVQTEIETLVPNAFHQSCTGEDGIIDDAREVEKRLLAMNCNGGRGKD